MYEFHKPSRKIAYLLSMMDAHEYTKQVDALHSPVIVYHQTFTMTADMRSPRTYSCHWATF